MKFHVTPARNLIRTLRDGLSDKVLINNVEEAKQVALYTNKDLHIKNWILLGIYSSGNIAVLERFEI